MSICLKCGKETAFYLCESCKTGLDMEALCKEIIAYKPGSGENPIWEQLCSSLNNPYDLRNVAFALSDELPTPRKEYMKVMARAGSLTDVPKASRPWFYEIYAVIKDSESLSEAEKNRLHSIALGAYCGDYEYEKADAIASLLCGAENIPRQGYYNLTDFYMKTRRYDVVEDLISEALQRFADDALAVQSMKSQSEKNAKYVEKAESGKQEYLPKPTENKDAVRQKYVDFLASIGIEVAVPTPRKKAEIPKDQYPKPVETRDTDFDTFVAFDLETTGTNPNFDSIIEYGAVRVSGGQVIEKAEFTFQELAKPFERKLSEEIQQLTGITPDDVKDARQMWEVFADFMGFVGNDVLLGFNCMAFDSKYLVRAGRYANIVVENKYFDVMRYAERFKAQLGISAKKISLAELSEKLGVGNPEAHRALPDAVTTAKIFLKLKELDNGVENTSVDELLSDLEDW